MIEIYFDFPHFHGVSLRRLLSVTAFWFGELISSNSGFHCAFNSQKMLLGILGYEQIGYLNLVANFLFFSDVHYFASCY